MASPRRRPLPPRAFLPALALAATAGDGPVFLDTPEVNRKAVLLAEELGLTPQFETARMYLGPAPAIDTARLYGVTTFELG